MNSNKELTELALEIKIAFEKVLESRIINIKIDCKLNSYMYITIRFNENIQFKFIRHYKELVKVMQSPFFKLNAYHDEDIICLQYMPRIRFYY